MFDVVLLGPIVLYWFSLLWSFMFLVTMVMGMLKHVCLCCAAGADSAVLVFSVVVAHAPRPDVGWSWACSNTNVMSCCWGR
jgi:cellobiose-specific phosphotransferase system component IIB